jgi:hypothetical protein
MDTDVSPATSVASPPPAASNIADVARRIRAEYDEMPGLCLTKPQVARLFGLDADVCEHILRACVDAGVLVERDGRFLKA